MTWTLPKGDIPGHFKTVKSLLLNIIQVSDFIVMVFYFQSGKYRCNPFFKGKIFPHSTLTLIFHESIYYKHWEQEISCILPRKNRGLSWACRRAVRPPTRICGITRSSPSRRALSWACRRACRRALDFSIFKITLYTLFSITYVRLFFHENLLSFALITVRSELIFIMYLKAIDSRTLRKGN